MSSDQRKSHQMNKLVITLQLIKNYCSSSCCIQKSYLLCPRAFQSLDCGSRGPIFPCFGFGRSCKSITRIARCFFAVNKASKFQQLIISKLYKHIKKTNIMLISEKELCTICSLLIRVVKFPLSDF